MKDKSVIRKIVLPWDVLLLIRILNSLCKINIILFQRILDREGIKKKRGGMNSIPMTVLIQFIERLKLVEGSNDENRFIIIFRFLVFFYIYLNIF